MRSIKSFALFSLAISFLLLSSVLASPSGANLVNGNFQTQVSAPETHAGIDHFEIRIDETTWLDVDNDTSYKFINVDDSNLVSVKAFDKAENINDTYVSFKVDTTHQMFRSSHQMPALYFLLT
jgi:hypothetical protein